MAGAEYPNDFMGSFIYRQTDSDHGTSSRSDQPNLAGEAVSIKIFDTEETARRWLERQCSFAHLNDTLFNTPTYFHGQQLKVVRPHFDQTIHQWMEQKYREFRGTPDKWWKFIRADFMTIFAPVMEALSRGHLNGHYHGNVYHGICHTKKVGSLIDMADVAPSNAGNDFRDLIRLVREINIYVYRRKKLPVPAMIRNSDIEKLMVEQLSRWSTNIDRRWTYNPAIFWTREQRNHFLHGLYWLLYQYKNVQPLISTAQKKFKPWQNSIPAIGSVTRGSVEDIAKVSLRDIFDRDRYRDNLSQLRFWRNCQYHLIENMIRNHIDQAWLNRTDPARNPVVPMRIPQRIDRVWIDKIVNQHIHVFEEGLECAIEFMNRLLINQVYELRQAMAFLLKDMGF